MPERIELAKSLGATQGVNTAQMAGSLTEEVRKLTKEVGTTITIDATGVVPLIQQGVEFTANQGQVILLGVAPMDAGLQVQVVPFMVVCLISGLTSSYAHSKLIGMAKQTGKKLLGSMEGGVYPEEVKQVPVFGGLIASLS